MLADDKVQLMERLFVFVRRTEQARGHDALAGDVIQQRCLRFGRRVVVAELEVDDMRGVALQRAFGRC